MSNVKVVCACVQILACTACTVMFYNKPTAIALGSIVFIALSFVFTCAFGIVDAIEKSKS